METSSVTTPNTTNITNHTDTNAFEQLSKGLYVYGVPVICVFGITGNVLSFRVFVFTRFRKYSSSIYIAALSVSDTVFLCSLFLTWLGNGRIGIQYVHLPVWCHLMIYVTYVCSFLSVWYVVLITVDRYIVVCHSLHVRIWCSKRRARIAVGTVTLCGLLIYLHMFFTTEVMGQNCELQTRTFMIQLIIIVIYVDTVITFIFPFALIIVLNVIVLSSIRKFLAQHVFKGRHAKAPPNVLSNAQYRITRTFILISLMLLVTNLPSHGIRFYIILKGWIQNPDATQLAQAQQICQIIYYTNYATNFLLYSASSGMFRKYLSCRHICCNICKRHYSNTSNYLYQ